jgi:hypothetical protein
VSIASTGLLVPLTGLLLLPGSKAVPAGPESGCGKRLLKPTALLANTASSTACFTGLMPLAGFCGVCAAAGAADGRCESSDELEALAVLSRASRRLRVACQGAGEWKPRAGMCARAKAAKVAMRGSLSARCHC